ncbi:MAG: hypothetical protein K0S39_3056 [Paenibacillus sp.]|jgi:hypothetical protein|nr:hypothetical protein [Paenibacillus sp.]
MKARKAQKLNQQTGTKPATAAADSDPLNRGTGKPVASVQQQHELQ